MLYYILSIILLIELHLKHIRIQNILSFKNSDFYFNKYNIVVGINNSGKTNLIRTLQLVCRNSLGLLPLNQNQKFDQNHNSQILLQLQLTDEEIKLVLQTIFGTQINNDTFSETLKNLNVIINWNKKVSDVAYPNFVMYYFENGLTIIVEGESQIVFDRTPIDNSLDNIEELLGNIQSLNINSITNTIIKSGLYIRAHHINLGKNSQLLKNLLEDLPISMIFTIGNKKYYTETILKVTYDISNSTQMESDVAEYVGTKNNTAVIPLDNLLHKIISKNLTFIEEIYPTHQKLTDQLFDMKKRYEKNYTKLQKEFSDIFNGVEIRVDEVVEGSNNNSQWIKLTENDKEHNLKESASGHYALIHILYTILDKSNQILMIDEPELHFHPIKISYLSEKLPKLAKSQNNQIVIITHSPKFISHELLTNQNFTSLIHLNKNNGTSKVKSLPDSFQNNPKPHLFNPEIFFSGCTLIVEGASDKFAFEAISDYFGGLFKKYNILVMPVGGIDNVPLSIDIHNAFDIPFVAMVDKEYNGDMDNVIKLQVDLEDEYKKLGRTRKGKLKEDAYSFMQNLLKQSEGLQKVKTSKIWDAFEKAISKAGGDTPTESVNNS